MKQLTCEMCGSTDLIKQDGVFVCQSCGTKYSIEEAKKMMVEGTVEVTGTIKVDTAAKLNNLYQIARQAKHDGNNEMAAKYYEMILAEDSVSWEAYFYTAYFKALSCKGKDVAREELSMSNCVQTTYCLIRDQLGSVSEKTAAIKQVQNDLSQLVSLMATALVRYLNNNGTKFISSKSLPPEEETLEWRGWKAFVDVFGDDRDIMVPFGIEVLKSNGYARGNFLTTIKKYEPDYELPVRQPQKSGCYVATAIYGSYDCPQVWTLRRYRDNMLAQTWYGRAFIRTYYAISPTLVKWFGHTEWFKRMWKGKLDHMISALQANGVESTPYDDKPW